MTTDISQQAGFVAIVLDGASVTEQSANLALIQRGQTLMEQSIFLAIFEGTRVGVAAHSAFLALFPDGSAAPPRPRRISSIMSG